MLVGHRSCVCHRPHALLWHLLLCLCRHKGVQSTFTTINAAYFSVAASFRLGRFCLSISVTVSLPSCDICLRASDGGEVGGKGVYNLSSPPSTLHTLTLQHSSGQAIFASPFLSVSLWLCLPSPFLHDDVHGYPLFSVIRLPSPFLHRDVQGYPLFSVIRLPSPFLHRGVKGYPLLSVIRLPSPFLHGDVKGYPLFSGIRLPSPFLHGGVKGYPLFSVIRLLPPPPLHPLWGWLGF